MDRKELESALEAILFASGEPVQVDRICVALDIDRPTVEQLLQKLMDYYAYERRGIRLLKIDDMPYIWRPVFPALLLTEACGIPGNA